MQEVDGGNMPEFSEDSQEVRYFSATDTTDPSGSTESSSLTELPLFPLQLVLNPGTNIPLHVFEMRYRLLFNTIRDSDARFGIVLYDGNTNSLAEVGCSAELVRFEPLPDGRIMTNNVGRQRFRIVRIIEEKPYTRAMVQFLKDKAPEEDFTPLVQEVWEALQDVLRLSNKLYDKVLDLSPDIKRLAPTGSDSEKIDGDKLSAQRLEDFSFAVCQVLDMPLKEQQILLQMQNTGARLRRQNKMLQTARQYLAAQVSIKEAGLGGM